MEKKQHEPELTDVFLSLFSSPLTTIKKPFGCFNHHINSTIYIYINHHYINTINNHQLPFYHYEPLYEPQ